MKVGRARWGEFYNQTEWAGSLTNRIFCKTEVTSDSWEGEAAAEKIFSDSKGSGGYVYSEMLHTIVYLGGFGSVCRPMVIVDSRGFSGREDFYRSWGVRE